MSDSKELSEIPKELTTTVSKYLNERLSSPLTSAFVISWLLWNYKFVVIILSTNKISVTFSMIEQLCYPKWSQHIFGAWHTSFYAAALVSLTMYFLLPLASVLAYIFLYPKPALFVYERVLSNNKALMNAKKRAEDSGVISSVEAESLKSKIKELEKNINDISHERDSTVKQKDQEVQGLQIERAKTAKKNEERIDLVQKEHKDALAQKDVMIEMYKAQNIENARINEERIRLIQSENENALNQKVLEIQTLKNELDNEIGKRLDSDKSLKYGEIEGLELSLGKKQILNLIGRYRDGVTVDVLKKILPQNVLDIKSNLTELEKNRYLSVIRNKAREEIYLLTQKGQKYVFDLDNSSN